MVFGAPLTEEGIAQIYQLIEYLSKSEYHVFIPPQPLLLTCPLRLVLYFICTFYENKKPVCLSLVQTLCPSPFLLCPVVVYLASKHSIDFFFYFFHCSFSPCRCSCGGSVPGARKQLTTGCPQGNVECWHRDRSGDRRLPP